MIKHMDYRSNQIIFRFTIAEINQLSCNISLIGLCCKNVGKMLCTYIQPRVSLHATAASRKYQAPFELQNCTNDLRTWMVT